MEDYNFNLIYNIKGIKGICLIYFVVFTAGCGNMNLSKSPLDNSTLLQQSNKILFLTLKAEKDTIHGLNKIEIIQMNIADGKIKFIDNNNSISGIPGTWKISLLDSKNRIITSSWIENPFLLSREAFSEDGKIEKKIIQIYSTQIPFRFPYLKQMKKLQIDTLNLSKKYQSIYRDELSQTRGLP